MATAPHMHQKNGAPGLRLCVGHRHVPNRTDDADISHLRPLSRCHLLPEPAHPSPQGTPGMFICVCLPWGQRVGARGDAQGLCGGPCRQLSGEGPLPPQARPARSGHEREASSSPPAGCSQQHPGCADRGTRLWASRWDLRSVNTPPFSPFPSPAPPPTSPSP